MPGGEVMGERIPSESYGNVYSMMKDFPSLSGSIFRIPTVAKVNVGDTPEQVLAVLGEP